VHEVPLPESRQPLAVRSFLACAATILELPLEDLPKLPSDGDPATGWAVSRWLAGRGLGIARVADPASFSWPGPWLARVGTPDRYAVMYGVPSGVVWDPGGTGRIDAIDEGFVLAATDIALALPQRATEPPAPGTVAAIAIAASAGQPAQVLDSAHALTGQGLAGDRHVSGTGTFPSGLPGSALTLIEAEVCESFDPPLRPDEHRRNLVTRGVDLNALVGRDFVIGEVRCRGMRLCEPCRVMDGYASRPLLRALVHRGGLRADILEDGPIRVGDRIEACPPG
jgi:MOSC domain-containing protein YiiM